MTVPASNTVSTYLASYPEIQILDFLNEATNPPGGCADDDPAPFDDQVITAVTEVAAELDLPNSDVSN